jgi:hypothetical protein
VAAAASRPAQVSPHQNWKPNNAATGVRYVGAATCAECHDSIAASQKKTPMGLALASPANCTILSSHPKLTYRSGKYSYSITRTGSQSLYSVTDGAGTLSVPILYCFGMGEGGQTYVLHHNGKFFESRVSFYRDIRGLDLTMGHSTTPPATLVEAMGREMAMTETRSCFGCHATNSLDGTTLQLDRLMEGVSCEACHGPGEKHVELMKTGELRSGSSGSEDQKHIFNPKKLSTEGVSSFCGACHRTWEDVVLLNIRGVSNVRFQPYRLANSKCYDMDDPRISCVACHDPHENRKHDAAFYDSKCTACHSATPKLTPAGTAQAAKKAPVCRVAKSNCASCHMPKYEIPGSHLTFRDHHIRIAKPGEPYPN